MKKKLIIFLWLIIILFGFNCNVYATGGGLRKNTIKKRNAETCGAN